MLVLTRQEDQEVLIGDPKAPVGRVRVVRICGNKVRLGFTFPRETPVHRSEVAEKIAAKEEE